MLMNRMAGILVRISRSDEKCRHPLAERFAKYCLGPQFCDSLSDKGAQYPPAVQFQKLCNFDLRLPRPEYLADQAQPDPDAARGVAAATGPGEASPSWKKDGKSNGKESFTPVSTGAPPSGYIAAPDGSRNMSSKLASLKSTLAGDKGSPAPQTKSIAEGATMGTEWPQ